MKYIENQLLTVKDVAQFIGFNVDWIYKKITKGEFPKPIKLGKSSRWVFSDIQEWINNLIKSQQTQGE